MKRIVAVDSQGCSPKTSGGAGVYAHELIGRLMNLESPEFEFVPVRFRYDDFKIEHLKKGKDVLQISKQKILSALPKSTAAVLKKTLARFAGPTSSLNPQFRPQITHQLTNYFSGEQVRDWVSQGTQLCVTFLDIQDYYFPDFFSASELEQRKREYQFYAQNSQIFFAISEFTKKTMIEHLHIKADKIIVTPLSASLPQALDEKGPRPEIVQDLEHYFVFPARYWRHKNHRFLFEAVGKLHEMFRRKKAGIVLTGHFSEEDLLLMNREVDEANATGLVRQFGFLPQSVKMALLQNASALVFPSLFEGFGMPVLEAMQVGCPVFASNSTSLPEIGGDAALYFDPKKVDSLISIFELFLEGRLDISRLIPLGQMQAKKFTWDRNVEQTLKGYSLI